MSSESDSSRILLGFEVVIYDNEGKILNPLSAGTPVYMSLHHTAVFGITQLSGKTKTLEAIISRSKLMAIAFKTKRGEAGFSNFHEIQAFYRSRADWLYVEGLLNVALGEKVKYQPFMRWAIQKVTEGSPQTLRDVLRNAERLRDQYSRRREVFEQLIAYLRIVVPELERWTFSDTLELQEGVNVMDISEMQTEVQQLVIASSIEEVFQHKRDVIAVVPEAWEQLPQGKMTPVKWVAEKFVRKGASIGNYLFLDSQDIGGLDKTPLRQCDNWLMGRMKESHEVERILKQLLGVKIAKEDIQTLPLGHFYAAIGDVVKKIYVLPVGISEDLGIQVALGKMKPEQIKEMLISKSQKYNGEDDKMWKEKYEEEKQKREQLERDFADMRTKIFQEVMEGMKKKYGDVEQTIKELSIRKDELEASNEKITQDNQTLRKGLELFNRFRELFQELLPSPSTPVAVVTRSSNGSGTQSIKLESSLTEITIEDKAPKIITMDTNSPSGRILYCAIQLHESLVFSKKEPIFSSAELQREAADNGWQMGNRQLGGTLMVIVREGWLIQVAEKSYRMPTKVKFNIIDKKEKK